MTVLHFIALVVGFVTLVATLLDAFESILLPRRINHSLRYSRLYYRTFWTLWRRAAGRVKLPRYREGMLSVFGPMSMLGLFCSWISALVIAFALIQWALPSDLANAGFVDPSQRFTTYLYFSGTTFFTLGIGDFTPVSRSGRALAVLESGLGLGFLAIIIGYLPVLYQAFSRREVTISLLDARAGSPPSGAEFILRLAQSGQIEGGRIEAVDRVLLEWERWCAELLESHISFPVLAYYRSQHANQSWLAALTTMLDASSLLLALMPEVSPHQARLTLAMARHAAVDIALIFNIRPVKNAEDRYPDGMSDRLHAWLDRAGRRPTAADTPQHADRLARLTELRGIYEPFLFALSDHFRLALPPLLLEAATSDNWQRSAWMARAPALGALPTTIDAGDHFN